MTALQATHTAANRGPTTNQLGQMMLGAFASFERTPDGFRIAMSPDSARSYPALAALTGDQVVELMLSLANSSARVGGPTEIATRSARIIHAEQTSRTLCKSLDKARTNHRKYVAAIENALGGHCDGVDAPEAIEALVNRLDELEAR